MKTIYENENFSVMLFETETLDEVKSQYKVMNKEYGTYDYDCQSEIQALIAAEEYDIAKRTRGWKMPEMGCEVPESLN